MIPSSRRFPKVAAVSIGRELFSAVELDQPLCTRTYGDAATGGNQESVPSLTSAWRTWFRNRSPSTGNIHSWRQSIAEGSVMRKHLVIALSHRNPGASVTYNEESRLKAALWVVFYSHRSLRAYIGPCEVW